MDKNAILRQLPKMDAILEEGCLEILGRSTRTTAAKTVLEAIRSDILSDLLVVAPTYDEILAQILETGQAQSRGLQRVINATGIVLHTNLGRAPLPENAPRHIAETSLGYSTLEFDTETGGRGSRMAGLEAQLVNLTGAEAAIAVNNNAAAVLLALSALCAGGEVVVSRGELVEIGGSFRVPEVIAQGGAVLREVGATNSTRLSDYENAINTHTTALLKVHTSNYRVEGFTKEVDLAQLRDLAQKHNLPLIYDLGGGALIDLSHHEPTVQALISGGVDVLCFSGDKLLGGPQAGIILGRSDLVAKMHKHPLYRALRMDKLTIAALSATLEHYEDLEQAKEKIPVLAMLTTPLDKLKEKAEQLREKMLNVRNCKAEIVETMSQAGGGSLPGENFPSYAISLSPDKISVEDLAEKLRGLYLPIIGRIHKGRLLLDVRTIDPTDFSSIAWDLQEILAD
ncbi:MAG: L-seryl-tRNA(Sec) selenium transferase [Defluviitaleaceae bacterium]|nr:L-seryl-tRNA(Sec) selenium transferase [Defluviitaleaceae bacterium]